MILLRLYYEFFKIGLFAVGGGLATIPFLRELALRTNWYSVADLMDMIAISESTPGPIGVNMATYAGFSCAGIPGSIIATLGLVTPSLVVILIVIGVLAKFRSSKTVEHIFSGLRPASLGMIAAAGISLVSVSLVRIDLFRETGELLRLFNFKCIALAVAVFFLMKKFKCHPGFYLLGSAVLGVVLQMAK